MTIYKDELTKNLSNLYKKALKKDLSNIVGTRGVVVKDNLGLAKICYIVVLHLQKSFLSI